MKIIIHGEYSGVGRNLRTALNKNKFQNLLVEHHHRGDGYKLLGNIPVLFSLMGKLWPILSILLILLKPPKILVFFSPFFIPVFPWLNTLIVKIFSKRVEKLVFMPCTNDAVWWHYEEQDPQVKPREGFLGDLNGKVHRFTRADYLKTNQIVALISDTILPMNADYLDPYLALRPDAVYCPFPIDVDNLNELANSQPKWADKIIISHGITRPGLKGSDKIVSAIQNFTPESQVGIKFNSFERVSFSRFIAELIKTDIYMDQANSHSAGIAGLTALWFCPIVFSGNSKKHKIMVKTCPIQHSAVNQVKLKKGITKAISDIQINGKYRLIEANRQWLKSNHWDTQLYVKLILGKENIR